ncbi:hypothetical protein, partial [Lewinella sp. W8]|uniref:hypothetical protein n=1 Tax=Lewinella sp. W8 TaxID=2528208 RepID=UPI00156506BB
TFVAAAGTFDPTGASLGVYTFTYGIPASGGCAADDETVTIIIEDCCPDTPILSIGSVECVDALTFQYTFAVSEGATVSSLNGSVNGNVVTVSLNTNDVLTAYNDITCDEVSLSVTSPLTCVIDCEQPDLTLGNAICAGGTYSVAFTETTGATISVTPLLGGIVIGANLITGVPLGVDLVVTAVNPNDVSCLTVLTATSPTAEECGPECPEELISVSALGVCSADGSTYSVNFVLTGDAVLTTEPAVGTIGANQITGIPAGTNIRLIATDADCNKVDDILVTAPDCCPDAPILSIGSVECVDALTFQYTFSVSEGATVSSLNGSVNGNVVTVSLNTNDVLTAYNDITCDEVSLSVTSPLTCVIDCEQPDLTLGNAICAGGTYSVAFTETTGATISVTPLLGGIVIGTNLITGVPLGVDLVVTAVNPNDVSCLTVLTATSPTAEECGPECPEELISVSALGVCSADGSTYAVNFVLTGDAVLTTEPAVGTIGANQITGIPAGTNIRLIATDADCNKTDDILVTAPDCCPDAPILSIGSVECVDVLTFQYTFSVSKGATVSSLNGSVNGNVVTVSLNTNDVLTAYNDITCDEVSLSVTSPLTCVIDCEQPDLTLGNAICAGGTYSVAFTETTGATISVTPLLGGIVIGANLITGVPLGVDLVVTAVNPNDVSCLTVLTATSPTAEECGPECPEELISVSALGVCSADGSTYAVNFVLTGDAVLTTEPVVGTIGANQITGIPAGTNIRLIATDADCNKTDDILVTAPVCSNLVKLNVKVRLQGALLGSSDGKMRDDLRSRDLIPSNEPYTALSNYTHVGGGGMEAIMDRATVLADRGDNSIIDWVFVELRSAADPAQVVATRAGLLQKDGDVVETDGVSSLCFTQSSAGDYYVAVRHRNHIGTMTANSFPLTSEGTEVDFTDTSLELWTNQPNYDGIEQATIGGAYALWAGNTNADDRVVFAGQVNDKDIPFNEVDNAPGNILRFQTYVYGGYHLGDVNLDGDAIFAGQNNDVDHIFNNVDGFPVNILRFQTYVMLEQLAK